MCPTLRELPKRDLAQPSGHHWSHSREEGLPGPRVGPIAACEQPVRARGQEGTGLVKKKGDRKEERRPGQLPTEEKGKEGVNGLAGAREPGEHCAQRRQKGALLGCESAQPSSRWRERNGEKQQEVQSRPNTGPRSTTDQPTLQQN